MKHGEAVLRMYDPNYNVAAIIGRRRINGNPWFKRGTLYRCALDTLRTAAKPLTARELVIAMLAAKGIKNAPAARVRSLRGGVTNSLRNNEGRTVECVGEGSPMRWRLKPGAFGFLTLTHCGERPDLYSDPSRFDRMPSQPSLQTCYAGSHPPGSIRCSTRSRRIT